MQKKPKKLQRIWFIENDAVKMGYYIGECMTQSIFNPTTYTKKAAIAMDGTPRQTTRTLDEIFETEDEAQKELQRRNRKEINRIKNTIKSVNDLVSFPIKNLLTANAKTAYIERAQELGFNINQ
ncbi:MAG: hypothetical protein U0L73_13055 [Ruminococcus bromii]|nr:hypothetical protein [Ruminococcus bromii]